MIKVGDVIQCYDRDEAIAFMRELAKMGIDTSFDPEERKNDKYYVHIVDIPEGNET